MAKTILPKGIASVSGKMGALMYKTYTRPDGTKETRVYSNPYRHGYQRSTPVTEKEQASRQRFAAMQRAVSLRMRNGDRRTKKEIWDEVKREMNSEK